MLLLLRAPETAKGNIRVFYRQKLFYQCVLFVVMNLLQLLILIPTKEKQEMRKKRLQWIKFRASREILRVAKTLFCTKTRIYFNKLKVMVKSPKMLILIRKFEVVWVQLSLMNKTEYSLVALLLWMPSVTYIWLNGIYRVRAESQSRSLSPDNRVHLQETMVMNWDYWALQQWH